VTSDPSTSPVEVPLPSPVTEVTEVMVVSDPEAEWNLSFNDHLIPVEPGHAVSSGWGTPTKAPVGITWHWTATWDLATCRRILGGADPLRKGDASAHYCVGLSFEEGIDRYVHLENRSWHAGVGQEYRWDGQPLIDRSWIGARSTVGIETVNIGYARNGVEAGENWIKSASPSGKHILLIPPWTEEQIQMMVTLGRHIVEQFPGIRPEDHHGHSDICPGRKTDVLGFPFARVLRGIYQDDSIPDIWTPYLTVEGRQRALIDLGYDLGPSGADGDWGRMSEGALVAFQRAQGMEGDGTWTVFVSRLIYKAFTRVVT